MGTSNASFNQTLWDDPGLCTVETCPLDWATIRYVPSLAGNVLYLAIFAIILLFQGFLGSRHRTWSFFSAMIGGLVLEVIGYAGRLQMHDNIFLFNPFLMYLICLTIAPCFLSAAIYLSLSRVIVVYGEHLARFKPRTYTIIFICSDVFSLVLQATGGALADQAADDGSGQTGINIMIAGLAWQVVSLVIFIALCADFAHAVLKDGLVAHNRALENLRTFSSSHKKMKGFMFALLVATATIFTRSCYRVAELQEGFDGDLANQQAAFMILEGAMIIIACIALTALHPGLVLGEFWSLKTARATLAARIQATDRTKNENKAHSEPQL